MRPSTSTKATPRRRKRPPNLTLRLRRYLVAPSQLRQECSHTPRQLRTLIPQITTSARPNGVKWFLTMSRVKYGPYRRPRRGNVIGELFEFQDRAAGR
jgi:hypothetical protein